MKQLRCCLLTTLLLLCQTGCTIKDYIKPVTVFETPPAHRTLEHKLLIIHVRSLIDQHTLINNSALDSKQFSWQKASLLRKITKKEHALLYCAHYHKDKQLSLALSCAQLAHDIRNSRDSTELLKKIKQNLDTKARKQQINKTVAVKRKRDALMTLAKKQMRQPNHGDTINTLNQVLKATPGDKEARVLLKELNIIQQQQVVELLTMGDQLYRNENIEQALAVWKAAKNLAPDHKEVIQRIERAEKVLGNVNKIKSQPSKQ